MVWYSHLFQNFPQFIVINTESTIGKHISPSSLASLSPMHPTHSTELSSLCYIQQLPTGYLCYAWQIAHLEPDILECKVKWALGSISTNKASGGNGVPIELLQILKDDAVRVLHSICQQIWKTQQWPQEWKRSIFIPTLKKAMPKNVQTTTQLHSSHRLAK